MKSNTIKPQEKVRANIKKVLDFYGETKFTSVMLLGFIEVVNALVIENKGSDVKNSTYEAIGSINFFLRCFDREDERSLEDSIIEHLEFPQYARDFTVQCMYYQKQIADIVQSLTANCSDPCSIKSYTVGLYFLNEIFEVDNALEVMDKAMKGEAQ